MLYNILSIIIVLICVILSVFLKKYLDKHTCPHCGAFIKHPTEILNGLSEYCYKCHRYFEEPTKRLKITRKYQN